MENQHRKIIGYRELNEAEIALMNEVKRLGEQVEMVVNLVREHVQSAPDDARGDPARDPFRWLSIGRTDLQTGLMALNRAIARPGGF